MPASRSHFERPLGGLLALDVGKVGQVARRVGIAFDAGGSLISLEQLSERAGLGQVARFHHHQRIADAAFQKILEQPGKVIAAYQSEDLKASGPSRVFAALGNGIAQSAEEHKAGNSTLQIGLLDPIALTVRSLTTSVLPTVNKSTESVYTEFYATAAGKDAKRMVDYIMSIK